MAALGACLALAGGLGADAAIAQAKKTPYWASISVPEARMRVGPSLDYPANWVYRRRDLPVKVVQVHSNWRKVQDPDGTAGWMHVRLLSDAPTAIVTEKVADMRNERSDSSSLLYRAERGVVGRISDCDGQWCLFDVAGRRAFVRTASIWGATSR